MEGESLFDILAYRRGSLLDFLQVNGSFDNLKNLLTEIEENNGDTFDIIRKLFLGNIGFECNKQAAFYELPTHELVKTITNVCEELEIFKVEEIASGTGLLSGLLARLTNLEINATDGKTWINTTTNFHQVQEKLFLEYAMDNITNYDDKLMVISWIPDKVTSDIEEMMTKRRFKQVLIIGERYNKCNIDVEWIMFELGYNKIIIPTKQLCYNDYFANNKMYPEDGIKSCCTLYLLDNHEVQIESEENAINVIVEPTERMIIQDMVIYGVLPKWTLNMLNDDIIKKTIVDIESSIRFNNKNKTMIFDVIENINEFNFWFNKHPNFPKIITKEKFIEFYNICEILNDTNGLETLKQKYFIPQWIMNKDEAEKYLYLDFSSTTKKWKESRDTFVNYYNTTRNQSQLMSMAGSIFGI